MTTTREHIAMMAVLMEIRGLLFEIARPGADEVPDGCDHPEDERISLGFTNGAPHWVCQHCRYEHRSVMES